MRKRLALLVLLTVVAGVVVFAGASRRALASGTILDTADGSVFVRHAGVESVARDDAALVEGDEVRTGEDGHAVILFFDGSTLALEPETSVRIDAAHVEDGGTIVGVYQSAGTTWHAVQRILDSRSRYEVTTPGMVAAVRGTAFQVSVGDDEDDVTTEEGTVEVAAQRQSVRVTPGFHAGVRHGSAPRAPEQAPRPQRVLRIDLVGGSGGIVDRARRAAGANADGSLRNAIPGARVERDGDVVHVFVPEPARDLHFVAGSGLRSVRYAVVDASGRILTSGEAVAPSSGALPQVFRELGGSLPDPTPTRPPRTPSPIPSPSLSPRPLPSGTPLPTASLRTAFPTLPTRTPSPSIAPAWTTPTATLPSLGTAQPTATTPSLGMPTPLPTPLPTLRLP